MPFRARKTVLLAALALGAAGFAWLGTWQLDRLSWKEALIDRVEARIHAAPSSLPADWAGITEENADYLRVHATGVYDGSHEVRVYTPSDAGPAWWVMTPLRLADGRVVMVDRGLVPDGAEAAPPPAGQVEVTGLLRLSQDKGWLFAEAPRSSSGMWRRRDLGAIGRAEGIALAPFYIDAERAAAGPQWPEGGRTVVAFRNAHLSYALTWFALTGLCVLGAGIVLAPRRNQSISSVASRRSVSSASTR